MTSGAAARSRSARSRRARRDARGRSAPSDQPAPAEGSAAPERTVCLVSLGCSKALVDSEVMVGHLQRAGMTLVTRPQDSDVVIINTCGFIDEARQESVETVQHYVEMKRRGAARVLESGSHLRQGVFRR